MSRKHNCKHPNRGISNYPERLRRRGLGKSPVMEPLEVLKRRQRTTAPIPEAYAGWNIVDESDLV
jgi:hypothetical protein